MPVARSPLRHPSGELAVAGPSNKAHLSRLERAGKAFRLAPGLYVVGAVLPRDHVVRHHRLAAIAHVWPGAVLGDRTALDGGLPSDGWMFVVHPEPGRKANLHLDGLTVAVRVGPGPLPATCRCPMGCISPGRRDSSSRT